MTSYTHPSRNQHHHGSTSIGRHALNLLSLTSSAVVRKWRAITPRSRAEDKTSGWIARRTLSVPNLLTLLWVAVIFWAERWTFSRSIDSCDWRFWESWPASAQPHHLIFIADPQLVDPHTYPGRPWPLSSLTVRYTDLYLQRTYSLIQQNLYPDTTIFLGDLFDGGREWSHRKTESAQEQWHAYGDSFWIREYMRFSNMFVKSWVDAGVFPRVGQPVRRKLMIHLPGNHDLGFSAGIQRPIRDRFNAYFDEGNRVDVVGNHTFVSVDSVSLSAKEHSGDAMREIWSPSSEFLDSIQTRMKAAVHTELKMQKGEHALPLLNHSTVDVDVRASLPLPKIYVGGLADLPTVLLSHVPLFRDKGTPCGPLREHSPPSMGENGKPLEVDEGNAIAVAAGYQYQNVLSRDITREITSKIGHIKYAFSGDDHDYCEVLHRGYPSNGGIREITVKSLSWAMGVRKPGFVMVSLWNPIDEHANSLRQGAEGQNTMQTHLCLLPDQLGIFIRYALLLILTTSVLLIRAGHLALNPTKSSFGGSESPLLPTTRESSALEPDKLYNNRSPSEEEASVKAGRALSSDSRGLSARSYVARARSVSPYKSGGYGLPPPAYRQEPLIAYAGYRGPPSRTDAQEVAVDSTVRSKTRRLKGLGLFYAEFRWSLIRVAAVVLMWYLWLVWRG